MNALQVIRLWLTTAIKASRGMTLLLCAVTIGSSALGPLAVYGVSQVIGAMATGGSPVPGSVFLGVVLLLDMSARQISQSVGSTLDEKIQRHIRHDLLNLTASIPSIEHHETPAHADRLAILDRDSDELGGIYRLLMTVGTLASVITLIAMLWSIHPALISLLPIAGLPPLVNGVTQNQRNALRKKLERYRRLAFKAADILIEPAHAVEVRCYRVDSTLSRVASDALRLRGRTWVASACRQSWLTGMAWILFGLVYALAVLATLASFKAGAIDVATFSLLLLIGPQLVSTGSSIAANARLVFEALETFDQYQWLRTYTAQHSWSESKVVPPQRLREGIKFENVTFSYSSSDSTPSSSRQVLQNIDLMLPAGSTVAFVGDNGAGKSTLIKLLARLYDPAAGTIYVDGIPLSSLDAAAWRSRLSAGFQDFARFEFLTRESVGVGLVSQLDDEEGISRAIRAGEAQGVVEALPYGIDSQLGTRFDGGVGLSAGQWQRLALARAFRRADPLLMLLDEPTAALDPESEHAMYARNAGVARDLAVKTGAVTILVSHRLSTVRMADLIVVISNGTVAELGTHEDLVEADGYYARLFQLQARAYRPSLSQEA